MVSRDRLAVGVRGRERGRRRPLRAAAGQRSFRVDRIAALDTLDDTFELAR